MYENDENKGRNMRNNWQTSLVGLITGILGILGVFHVGVPQTVTDNVPLIASVGAMAIGLLAKDGKHSPPSQGDIATIEQ